MLSRIYAFLVCLSVFLAGGAQAQEPADMDALLRCLRKFEINTAELQFQFAGIRHSQLPNPSPTLSDGGKVQLVKSTDFLQGTFEKFGRAFRARFRHDYSRHDLIAVSDGKNVAEYEDDGEPDLNGAAGSFNAAKYKCSVPLMDFFGVLQTGDADKGDADWFRKPSLSQEVEQASLASTKKLSDGTQLFKLSGLAEDFEVVIDPRHPGEVASFGFILNRNGAHLTKRWSLSGFKAVDGKWLPTKLSFFYEFAEGGNILEQDAFDWQLSKIRAAADKERVLSALPDGLVFTTYDGTKAGKVAVQGGHIAEVEPDFGTEAYKRAQLIRRLAMLAAILVVFAGTAAFLWRLRVSRMR